MKIGCLQYSPITGDIPANTSRVQHLLANVKKHDLHLLVLPELALTGTGFKSRSAATTASRSRHLTDPFITTLARTLSCTIALGYPELCRPSGSRTRELSLYNSLSVINPEGTPVANYRAVQRQPGDMSWADGSRDGWREGWVNGLGKVAMGLSMDINTNEFRGNWNTFDFAVQAQRYDSNLILLSFAWPTPDTTPTYPTTPTAPDLFALSYWLLRLEPLIRSSETHPGEILVIIANRTGTEPITHPARSPYCQTTTRTDVIFAGTSAVLGIVGGQVKCYGMLGRGEEGLLVVDTEKDPHGWLIMGRQSNPIAERAAQEAAFFARATNLLPPQPTIITSFPRRLPTLSLKTTPSFLAGTPPPKPVRTATPINPRPQFISLTRPSLTSLIEVAIPETPTVKKPPLEPQHTRTDSNKWTQSTTSRHSSNGSLFDDEDPQPAILSTRTSFDSTHPNTQHRLRPSPYSHSHSHSAIPSIPSIPKSTTPQTPSDARRAGSRLLYRSLSTIRTQSTSRGRKVQPPPRGAMSAYPGVEVEMEGMVEDKEEKNLLVEEWLERGMTAEKVAKGIVRSESRKEGRT